MTKLILRVFEDPRDPGSVYVARRLSGEMAPPPPPAVSLGRQRDGSIVARVLPGENMFGVPYAELRQRVGSELELEDRPGSAGAGTTGPPATRPLDAEAWMRAHLKAQGIEPREPEPEPEAHPGEPALATSMRKLVAARGLRPSPA